MRQNNVFGRIGENMQEPFPSQNKFSSFLGSKPSGFEIDSEEAGKKGDT